MTHYRAFKCDCIYGATGTYKTSQIGHVALWYWRKHKLKTRLVSADGGGWEPLQYLVDAGIIEAWPVTLWPHRIEAIDQACQGYWPSDLSDPAKPMLPPAQIKEANVGFYAFEGLTSFGQHVMSALKKPGVGLSQEPSYVLKDGGTSYAGGSMAAFGFVQDRIYEFVMKAHNLPFIRKALWTALEAKGEEEGTKIPIFGPSIEGKKATGKAGQWFGNTIHMEAVATDIAEDKESKQLGFTTNIYMYLRTHADPNSRIPFPAKVRAPISKVDKVPEKLMIAPGKQEPNLATVYQLLEDLQEESRREVEGIVNSKEAGDAKTK